VSATATPRRYRARVVPRAPGKGSGKGRAPIASRINWDRVGRIALTLVVFGILIAYVKPVFNLVDTWRESNAADAQLTELKQDNEQLSRRAIELKSPSAALEEARKRGYVAEGETAYVIKGLGE